MNAKPKLTFEGKTVEVVPGTSILMALRQMGHPIRSDCEFGTCGTDPVVILSGMENLSESTDDEAWNLHFNKFPPNVRMACVTKIFGDIEIELFN